MDRAGSSLKSPARQAPGRKSRVRYAIAVVVLVSALASGPMFLLSSGCTPGSRVPKPLGVRDTIQHYQDGVLFASSQPPDFGRDVKRVSHNDADTQLVDYPKGYAVTVPNGMEFDFSCSPDFTKIHGDDLEIRIGRDSSPYLDVKGWLDSLPNEFMTDETYRKANDIAVNEDAWIKVNGRNTRIFSLTRTPRPESAVSHNSYTYAYVRTGGLMYYTVHFRYGAFEEKRDLVRRILDSLSFFDPKGAAAYNLDLAPALPKWDDETAALYAKIRDSAAVQWGFFTPNPFTPEGKAKIEEVESKLDFEFPVIMWYRYLGHEFPLEGMRDAYESGKIVEMTYQVAGDLYGKNPVFEVLDGRMEEDIRMFARGAKEFSHPFLLRLNNEMNSTWVSYSGHLSLNDPDVFKAVWRRVYDIFQEEGVDNAIWIWNPNDVSYPPCKWNSHVAYYPGNEYVQMIGVTGYNTGNYFRDLTGEQWRSFTDIYDRLWGMYKDLYADFPWIITEFACSSVGGDKEAWINEMFDNMHRYRNIKIAVWWSYFDPDPREETYGTPARRYWLDEKPEYLEAFRRGLERTQPR